MQMLNDYVKSHGGVIEASKRLKITRNHCYNLLKKEVIIYNDRIFPELTRRKLQE